MYSGACNGVCSVSVVAMCKGVRKGVCCGACNVVRRVVFPTHNFSQKEMCRMCV